MQELRCWPNSRSFSLCTLEHASVTFIAALHVARLDLGGGNSPLVVEARVSERSSAQGSDRIRLSRDQRLVAQVRGGNTESTRTACQSRRTERTCRFVFFVFSNNNVCSLLPVETGFCRFLTVLCEVNFPVPVWVSLEKNYHSERGRCI